MKTKLEIIKRSCILECLHDRASLESNLIDDKKYSLKARGKQKSLIYSFLLGIVDKSDMKDSEIKFFETKIGKTPLEIYEDFYIQLESLKALMWSLGILKDLDSYDFFRDDLYYDELEFGDKNPIKKLIHKSIFRPIKEIHIQKEISMIWHWRCVEYLYYGNIEFKENLKDIIINIFGKDYIEVMDKIQDFNIHKDLMVGKKPFYQITQEQCREILRISTYRQHAFEWLFSEEDWDDVDVDS